MKHTAQKIHQALIKANKVIIVPHPYPDGDAFGSASAIHEYLARTGREPIVYCSTAINPRLSNLPNSPEATDDTKIFEDREIDIVLVLDSGDLRYAGIAEAIKITEQKNNPPMIINIDHHNTNEYFGQFNLVDTNAAATTEIVYKFFEYNRQKISPHMATNLLTGLITDTDNFTNSATTPRALGIAGDLVRLGANYNLINYFTQKDKTVDLLKLYGTALLRLTKNEEKNLTYTYLKKTDFEKYNIGQNEGDGLANFMNNIDDTKIMLILKETADGKVKGSFRTTDDNIDVSAWAKNLGGGGHKKAAGFTLEGTAEEALERILTLDNK
jgi:phosphoesterase RecJ-like protein